MAGAFAVVVQAKGRGHNEVVERGCLLRHTDRESSEGGDGMMCERNDQLLLYEIVRLTKLDHALHRTRNLIVPISSVSSVAVHLHRVQANQLYPEKIEPSRVMLGPSLFFLTCVRFSEAIVMTFPFAGTTVKAAAVCDLVVILFLMKSLCLGASMMV